MKKSFETKGILLLSGIFLSANSFTFAQSSYREPVKETTQSTTNTSAKNSGTRTYTKSEQAMIDFYSDPKNSAEVAKTAKILEAVKPLGDGFYAVTELGIIYEDIQKKLSNFESAYKVSKTRDEKISLLNGIINSYNAAESRSAKITSDSSAYSESDKSKIAKYKGYYPQVLVILKDMLKGQN